jgi:[ribosomal protein S5]-alanine N-acetyltransferase
VADAEEALALRLANREFLAPSDPERDEDYFTLEAQRRRLERSEHGYAILDGAAIAGVISLTNVVYGPFCNANVGYWVDEGRNGRGLATRALAAIVELAFGELGLHRVEAGTLVDNLASQRVLEKNGFELIGLARRYLKIAGEWRDHLLFQRVADE